MPKQNFQWISSNSGFFQIRSFLNWKTWMFHLTSPCIRKLLKYKAFSIYFANSKPEYSLLCLRVFSPVTGHVSVVLSCPKKNRTNFTDISQGILAKFSFLISSESKRIFFSSRNQNDFRGYESNSLKFA